MSNYHTAAEDPFYWVGRAWRKLHSLWLSWTYPFASVGPRFSAHPGCDLRRSVSPYIYFGKDVLLEKNVRIDVPVVPSSAVKPVIVIEDNCGFGHAATILGVNHIHIGRNTICAASVLITDHNHVFEHTDVPIRDQGATTGGTVRIEEGCWIGYGTAIVSTEGELTIGRNSVVGANSLVTRSIPPCSVVTGNPGRVVKQFDITKGEWVLGRASEVRRTLESELVKS